MPIRPENRHRYPRNWPQIRKQILERTNHQCEGCGVPNYWERENEAGEPVRIVLTIAHLNHRPEDCRPENLRAWCQRCHNQHDAATRAKSRGRRRREEIAKAHTGDLIQGAEQ